MFNIDAACLDLFIYVIIVIIIIIFFFSGSTKRRTGELIMDGVEER